MRAGVVKTMRLRDASRNPPGRALGRRGPGTGGRRRGPAERRAGARAEEGATAWGEVSISMARVDGVDCRQPSPRAVAADVGAVGAQTQSITVLGLVGGPLGSALGLRRGPRRFASVLRPLARLSGQLGLGHRRAQHAPQDVWKTPSDRQDTAASALIHWTHAYGFSSGVHS